MIQFRPGNQIKHFNILRKSTIVSGKGKVTYGDFEKIGTLSGTISQASQKEQMQYGQQEHPVTHTVVVKSKTIAQAEDILELNGRKFYIRGKDNPAELGIYEILYCDEGAGSNVKS